MKKGKTHLIMLVFWLLGSKMFGQIPTRSEFLAVCDSFGVKHGNVVWAQARLESGNFKSTTYKRKKNCLGIYDSRKKEYAKFGCWQECLKAYRDRVQYKRGNVEETDEEYLRWLISMGYAADTAYGTKVIKIMKSEGK